MANLRVPRWARTTVLLALALAGASCALGLQQQQQASNSSLLGRQLDILRHPNKTSSEQAGEFSQTHGSQRGPSGRRGRAYTDDEPAEPAEPAGAADDYEPLSSSDATPTASDDPAPDPDELPVAGAPSRRSGAVGRASRESPSQATGTTQASATLLSSPASQAARHRQLQAPLSATFDVDMSADRMLIQPAEHSTSTMGSQLPADELPGELGANERRQDLLYPSSALAQPAGEEDSPAGRVGDSAPVCYTSAGLSVVVLVTALVTLSLSFCFHLLIRQLARRQFDLVQNSKQFEWKHPTESQLRPSLVGQQQPTGKSEQQQQQQLGCAFANPYFTDAPERRQTGKAEQSAQQLYFIEHHISKLHSRQVTSSVNELSVAGELDEHDDQQAAKRVVDLTSDEQRARIIACPREGDLVAVDLSAHDVIGLGFDICGNEQDGIYVRSVLARGPARDSACVHPGDRIKSININFEQVNLADASDILNSAAPYQLRLLLEKCAVPTKLLGSARLPAPLVPSAQARPPLRAPLAAPQAQPSGVLAITREYLRRLVAPDDRRTQQDERPRMDAYLGSSAARRPRADELEQHAEAHVNVAYGSEDDDDDDHDYNHQLERHQQHQQQQHQNHLNQRILSTGTASHTESASQRLTGSTGAFSANSANNSSLDLYLDRHAHHRLHGPRASESPVGTHLDLAGVEGAPGGAISRRQSAAGRLPAGRPSQLEQSQSQPEIAHDARAEATDADGAAATTSSGADPHGGRPRGFAGTNSSASTPTVHLAAAHSTGGQRADWRRTSSRRQRRRESIREEGASDSSYGDSSTSKLVQPANQTAPNSGATHANRQPPEEAPPTTGEFVQYNGHDSPVGARERTTTMDAQ